MRAKGRGLLVAVLVAACSVGIVGEPQLIPLHAGTNDRRGQADRLVQRIRSSHGEIARTRSFAAFDAPIPALVQFRRAGAGQHVLLVHQYGTFKDATMMGSDNIHPTQVGYALIPTNESEVQGPGDGHSE